jgi:hypothetical protein
MHFAACLLVPCSNFLLQNILALNPNFWEIHDFSAKADQKVVGFWLLALRKCDGL